MNESTPSLLRRMVDGFICLASWLSRSGAVLAALIMAAMTLHVMLEISLRAFFSTSTFVLDEFVGYGVAAMTFLSLGYAFETSALIRVNILLAKIRTHLMRRFVEMLCVLAAFGLTCYLANYFWRTVLRNWERGSTSETIAAVPLWIPEAFVLLGLAIFIIQMLSYIVKIMAGYSLNAETAEE